ncbi:DoxX family protein [Paenibacillus curdlanolyticus YK9]|uniref:DoxX family protein n=1 Tax=Paenibacillus curdlanolyticus YK9 TaxID=717606 RepID=E0IAD0_9BACL|nr:DoxX family protein [Paenibacillus curdlanolyticus]EFM10707.1 DoxX family protein [Paenibacillus curdlanolyticus YK9]
MKWVTRILQGLVALDFLFAGASKIFSSSDQIRELFTDKLGTPVVLIYTVGVFEALAGLFLIAGYRSRRAAVASIAVMIAILIGAIVTNLTAGLVGDAIVPFASLIVVAVLLYLKRDALKSTK